MHGRPASGSISEGRNTGRAEDFPLQVGAAVPACGLTRPFTCRHPPLLQGRSGRHAPDTLVPRVCNLSCVLITNVDGGGIPQASGHGVEIEAAVEAVRRFEQITMAVLWKSNVVQ